MATGTGSEIDNKYETLQSFQMCVEAPVCVAGRRRHRIGRQLTSLAWLDCRAGLRRAPHQAATVAPPAARQSARQSARQAIPMAVQVHPLCVCPRWFVGVFGRPKLTPVRTLWLRQRRHLRTPHKNRCRQLLASAAPRVVFAFDAASNKSTCIALEPTRLQEQFCLVMSRHCLMQAGGGSGGVGTPPRNVGTPASPFTGTAAATAQHAGGGGLGPRPDFDAAAGRRGIDAAAVAYGNPFARRSQHSEEVRVLSGCLRCDRDSTEALCRSRLPARSDHMRPAYRPAPACSLTSRAKNP